MPCALFVQRLLLMMFALKYLLEAFDLFSLFIYGKSGTWYLIEKSELRFIHSETFVGEIKFE